MKIWLSVLKMCMPYFLCQIVLYIQGMFVHAIRGDFDALQNQILAENGCRFIHIFELSLCMVWYQVLFIQININIVCINISGFCSV